MAVISAPIQTIGFLSQDRFGGELWLVPSGVVVMIAPRRARMGAEAKAEVHAGLSGAHYTTQEPG
jgi:hypothetical protein